MITPSNINLSKDKKILTIKFKSVDYSFSSEFLRVHSPSAEVLGYSLGQEILQLNKGNIAINKIRSVGNSQLKFVIVTTTAQEYTHGATFII